jgi:hypothetical protein
MIRIFEKFSRKFSKIIPFVIFVCGLELFPANLIKNVSLKINDCFAMYLAVKYV